MFLKRYPYDYYLQSDLKILSWYPLNYPCQLSVGLFQIWEPLKSKIDASSTLEQMFPHRGPNVPALWAPKQHVGSDTGSVLTVFLLPYCFDGCQMKQAVDLLSREAFEIGGLWEQSFHFESSGQKRNLSRWGSSRLLFLRFMSLLT